MDEIWGQACAALETSVGPNNFNHWIKPLRLTGVDEGIAHFASPTRFISDWVNRHFAKDILGELSRHGAPVERLRFEVVPQTAPGRARAAAPAAPAKPARPVASAAAPATARVGRTDLGAPLDPRYTFGNFVVGKPNELAHAAARRVAEGGPVGFNPLFLYGGVGLGKTHLMHAIAHEYHRRHPMAQVLYLSAEQFMYRFVQALRESTIMDFKGMFRNVNMLMVDDVQFIAGKDSTQEEFFHTFNALVDQGKQIVISADRAPAEIKGLEERIKSRLSSGLIVDVHPTTYELRLGILQSKTEVFRTQQPDLEIGAGVLEFLAHRITTNVRVLEGALQRLFAHASLLRREITLEVAQECLADILRTNDRKISIDDIQRKVAEHYNIRLADMVGPKRARNVARPRQIAMYLSKQLTSRSLPEIGRRFGGRDHTTIMHGIRKVEELVTEDHALAEDVALLKRLLEA
ncbi:MULTISPECIES: chromosomal replication initiator protein DnaA [Paracoccus]|uniref:Chromosomal replication initiator protein DnaA n=1 Tax=Paracoccus aerius TaxID=1915382 RepID=A0ABS1S051_9RHOB|nr:MULTISPECIES: chromosomal replication initiator protein DnaA [Paracoccus]MBL3672083.1 chromosomal replication initiator protein DnaA [Paracoccus aerius]QIR86151.1 chromosomal replication initiator protein DnaA [Paracoccus sp. AK26]GHG12957.1 chromosomal replication initiator protein DnaA [Paracoccus aerius]